MTLPARELQELHQGSPLFVGYKIDLTSLGGEVYYVTNNSLPSGGNASFGGQPFLAFPVQGTGFDGVLTGNQPKPTLTVSDVSRVFFSAVATLGDGVGGEVTRIVTYAKHLDDGSDPDASKFGIWVGQIDQKTEHIPGETITWALSALSDRMGFYLPRRQFLQSKGFPGLGLFRIA
jgi:lambda family phage minor tail protein L